MADPYLGEIRIFGGGYAPQGWMLCDGQTLSIHEYDALFALLGTTYGGNGVTTFALPDLRGRIPIGDGQGFGLSTYYLGQRSGIESVTLQADEMPAHQHQMSACNSPATTNEPGNRMLGNTNPAEFYEEIKPDTTRTTLNSETIRLTGGSIAHTNLMPSLCVSFIIAVKGAFPPRN